MSVDEARKDEEPAGVDGSRVVASGSRWGRKSATTPCSTTMSTWAGRGAGHADPAAGHHGARRARPVLVHAVHWMTNSSLQSRLSVMRTDSVSPITTISSMWTSSRCGP